MSALQLTRGILLHVDRQTGRLAAGRPSRLDLTQVPLKLWVTLGGSVDNDTGLLVNVSEINRVVRDGLEQSPPECDNAIVMLKGLWDIIDGKLNETRLLRLALDIAEGVKVTRAVENGEMIQMTTQYELAASHRLFREQWDDRHNDDVFGKCSNKAGHGHNYQVAVTLRGVPDQQTGRIADPMRVDEIVREWVLDRFDHKNLNEDTSEFAELMPTVENMSRVFWELLAGRFEHAELCRVAVWETPNTYAEYLGPGQGPLRSSESV